MFNYSVLVVDDDADVLLVAIMMLEDAGFAVYSAGNALDAMSLLDEHDEIGLIFTDIVMPGIDGFMLADMVKQHRPEINVLYATGYGDIGKARSQQGVVHGKILDKPYRAEQLRHEIAVLTGH
jgi:DNA-binding NtrC family response regulator